MSDLRNYYATITFDNPNYLPIEQKNLIDSNFVESEQFDFTLTLVQQN